MTAFTFLKIDVSGKQKDVFRTSFFKFMLKI